MARKPFSLDGIVRDSSQSGVRGVTPSHTRRGEQRWNAWGSITGTGRMVRLYYGPSFDDAVIARQKWEEAVRHEDQNQD